MVQVLGGLLDETVQSVHAYDEDSENFACLGSVVCNNAGSSQEVE